MHGQNHIKITAVLYTPELLIRLKRVVHVSKKNLFPTLHKNSRSWYETQPVNAV